MDRENLVGRDIECLLSDIAPIVASENFIIHRAGGKPLVTSSHITAFDNVSMRTPLHLLARAEFKRAESVSPGAAKIAMKTFTDVMFSTLKSLESGQSWVSIVEQNDAILANILRRVSDENRHPKWADTVEVSTRGLDQELVDIFKTAIDLAGPGGKIYVEQSVGAFSLVEKIIGNSFIADPARSILTDGIWKRDYAKCIVIDGLVESVAEIDRILNRAHETMQPTVIFARGFCDDALNTLVVNAARGTLDVMAVTVPIDLASINSMVDIAVVCGTDIVSSLKGDLISSINFDDMPVVQSVHCTPGAVVIRNDRTKGSVAAHTQRLMKSAENSNIEDLSVLTDRRIRSLTSDYVRLLIAGPNEFARLKKIGQLDDAIRSIKVIKAAGIISHEICCDRIPTLTFCSGVVSGYRLVGHLTSLLAGPQTY